MDKLYKLLYVESNASLEEIKRAYKKQMLKYHPDKNKDQASIDKFHQIQNAYHTIIRGKSCNDNPIIVSSDILDYCYMFLNELYKLYTENIHIKININLQEIYNGSIKKVVVKVKRKGILENIDLYISLLNYKKQYIFQEMGDDFPFPFKGKIRNDIIVNLEIIQDNNIRIGNVLNDYDLFLDEKINLYQLLFGTEISINLFNRQIQIKKQFITKSITNTNSYCIVVKNKGLPYISGDYGTEERGDLYVYLTLDINDFSYTSDLGFERQVKKYFN